MNIKRLELDFSPDTSLTTRSGHFLFTLAPLNLVENFSIILSKKNGDNLTVVPLQDYTLYTSNNNLPLLDLYSGDGILPSALEIKQIFTLEVFFDFPEDKSFINGFYIESIKTLSAPNVISITVQEVNNDSIPFGDIITISEFEFNSFTHKLTFDSDVYNARYKVTIGLENKISIQISENISTQNHQTLSTNSIGETVGNASGFSAIENLPILTDLYYTDYVSIPPHTVNLSIMVYGAKNTLLSKDDFTIDPNTYQITIKANKLANLAWDFLELFRLPSLLNIEFPNILLPYQTSEVIGLVELPFSRFPSISISEFNCDSETFIISLTSSKLIGTSAKFLATTRTSNLITFTSSYFNKFQLYNSYDYDGSGGGGGGEGGGGSGGGGGGGSGGGGGGA